MSQALKIGIIGGSGWLGGAVAGSLLRADAVRPENLSLSYRSQRPDHLSDAFWTRDNQALIDRSDVILLSVRPAGWLSLAINCTDRLVVSVMAGIRIKQLAEKFATTRVIRSMPNAATEVGKSYTPWIAGAGVSDEDRLVVRTIFDA